MSVLFTNVAKPLNTMQIYKTLDALFSQIVIFFSMCPMLVVIWYSSLNGSASIGLGELARNLATQWASSGIPSSADRPWVVWGQTEIVQLPWPAHGPHYKGPERMCLDCLPYF